MRMTLQTLYGGEADAQAQRYAAARETFVKLYGPGDVRYFRAPGRVNLIGEHTDYNHGFVLPVGLDKDMLVLARPRLDNTVRLSNVEADFPALTFDVSGEIPPGPAGDWGNYARGAAQELTRRRGRPLQGFDGLVVSQPPYGVPRQVGLSSSSALIVSIAVALARLNDWQLAGVELAQRCAEAEWYVGTRGGIMDQFVALLGQRDHALFLDCRPVAPGRYQMDHIPLPRGQQLLIADSGVRHHNVKGGYNRRVAACRAGVGLLQNRYPDATHLRDVQGVPWDEFAESLPSEITLSELFRQGVDLGDVPGLTPDVSLKVRARCRHVWTENRRVQAAVAAMRDGDTVALGRLLNEAHASVRDDYEVSCPELEILVQVASEVEGTAGARLTGAGWGGCIVALVDEDAVPEFVAHVGDRFRAQVGRDTHIFVCRSGHGAGEAFLE